VGIYRATSSSLCLTGTELLAITFNIQSCTAKREIGPPTFRRFSCWINHSKLILFSFNKFCVLYRYLAETFYFDWFDFSWTLTLSIQLMPINLISLSGNWVIKKICIGGLFQILFMFGMVCKKFLKVFLI
jgi:hypothetical protein